MRTCSLFLLLMMIFSASIYADTPCVRGKSQSQNLIIVTLDGVRWQEFFHGADPSLGFKSTNRETFPIFWSKYAQQGVVFGDKLLGSEMQVVGIPTSLPSYQTIFTGKSSSCFNNFLCMPGQNEYLRISEPSLFENIQSHSHLDFKEVAVLASWDKVPYAVERSVGDFFVNAGGEPLDDRSCDPDFDKINEESSRAENQPPWGSRFDRYTVRYAIHYLQKYRPRLLYISLNDTDEWGHLNQYTRYIEAMRDQDRWIDQLFMTLKKMGRYGQQTTVLITTDHGRGNGSVADSTWSNWTMHKAWIPESRDVWMYVRGPGVSPKGSVVKHPGFTHSVIKPLIEQSFGLPTEPSDVDRKIIELIGQSEKTCR